MALDSDFPAKSKLFILEDETITAYYLRRTLAGLGYETVATASDGKSALHLIAESRPDLLLADVGLEGEIDGVEVAIRARDEWKIPTIFLTAYSDPETLRRAGIATPSGYLVKPFTEHELHAAVVSALRSRDSAPNDHRRAPINPHLQADLGRRLALLRNELDAIWKTLPVQAQDANSARFQSILVRIDQLSIDINELSRHLSAGSSITQP